ncbi:MAG: hypothetical protein JWO54_555 [Candidatus Saccharibacteria bacterium]|jgi:hypothetical protein|nr:hypothetical protein [Candidatus Saccharibacteria bacterium]MDB5180784.1 hypothetical protein [Candidatus Saccharibacteria bacterium]MDB5180795.1 hypothetical protein [Candidatus Saccharibacteria bacterium]
MENGIRFESLSKKHIRSIAGMSFIIGLTLTGCSSEAAPPGPIKTAIDQAQADLDCVIANDPLADCDRDNVANLADVVPWRDDYADDDGDVVANRLDRWPGHDDKVIDLDGDTIPDYLDTFFGNNYIDTDNDGLINGFDPQPYVMPPSGYAELPPATLTPEQLSESLLKVQMSRKLIQEIYGPKQDTDYDGIPDSSDTNPTGYTNDRDNDGDPDFYDPKPNDYYTDSKNNPYDPRNDEYWED